MNSQGLYFYDHQPKQFSNENVWYGAGRYPSHEVSQRTNLPERRPGPLGDLYSTVDRTSDRQPRPVNKDNIGNIPQSHSAGGVKDRHPAAGRHIYELDHLATFAAAGSVPGCLLSAPDGVRRVREMAIAGAVWPLRVQVIIADGAIVVVDARTGEEMEHFPLSLVSEPTSATAIDRRVNGCETLDNLVLFTVLEDPIKKTSPPEMHVFQCVSRLGQEFVDDVLSAKASKGSSTVAASSDSVLPPSRGQQQPVHDSSIDSMSTAERAASAINRYHGGPPPGHMLRKSMQHEGWEPGQTESACSEATRRGVTLLDRCFSDIEQFMTRVQQAASAFKELDNRRSVRINKQAAHSGDGLLGMRARPPPAKDFVDILQKFKLSFILLARLKASIRDPNAPELVHFLFTPLTLIVNASRGDTQYSGLPADLAARVTAPLLTPDAFDLLDNCLTSKENELLQSLGSAWITSIDKWKGEIPPYLPRFYDGWQPPAFWLEEIGVPAAAAVAPRQLSAQYWRDSPKPMSLESVPRVGGARSQFGSDISSVTDREMRNIELQRKLAQDYQRQRELGLTREMEKTRLQGQHLERTIDRPVERYRGRSPDWDSTDQSVSDRFVARAQSPNWDRAVGRPMERDQVLAQPVGDDQGPNRLQPNAMHDWNRGESGPGVKTTIQKQVYAVNSDPQDFVRELKSRGAKIFKVLHDRESKNSKELAVKTDEIVEVLEDQKNWWKVRNSSHGMGYVPKTILEAYVA